MTLLASKFRNQNHTFDVRQGNAETKRESEGEREFLYIYDIYILLSFTIKSISYLLIV
jgi:hypothetical protein